MTVNPMWVVVSHDDDGAWSWRWECRTEAEAREKYQDRVQRGPGARTAIYRMDPTLIEFTDTGKDAR